jgi:REP-associated tyrosine transposase
MNFSQNNFYHIYNRGNNKQIIYFNRDNYLFFLKKIRENLLKHFDVLAYCLMPNHFHILGFSKENIDNQLAIRSIAITLSSYTQALNKQNSKTGNLFQRKTKAKAINSETNYLLYCINYIHQNPYKANLVNKIEDWEFSSFRDYIGIRNGTLCNINFGEKLLGVVNSREFYDISYTNIDERYINSYY